jgi:subtilisin-like proprotein convertase family protein
MKPGLALLFGSFGLAIAACGPSVQPGGGDDNTGDDGMNCDTAAEVCTGGGDEDCDGFVDCADVDCFGVGTCDDGPNTDCGMGEHLEGQPLALPDGTTQTSPNSCSPVSQAGYTSTLNFTGFSSGQILEDTSGLLGVCVNMEHSWLRDLQIEISCPSGAVTVLDMFQGTNGGEVFLGVPNDTDGSTPVPGTGYDYCWTPTAPSPMIPTGDTSVSGTIAAGDYAPACPFDSLVGCTLNGNWTIKVTDLWGIDNGFIFSWGVNFNPDIIEDCDNWPDPG